MSGTNRLQRFNYIKPPVKTNVLVRNVKHRPNSGGNSATSVCRALATPTRAQLELCARYPDVTASAIQGLKMAVQECQFQFRKNRWNCSTLEVGRNKNIHTNAVVSQGYRESAFVHAVTAAGVVQSIARACSLGKLMSCGCGQSSIPFPSGPYAVSPGSSRSNWRWSGCNHNIDFGVQFSKMLLDSREKGSQDIHSKINTHNNQVGRGVVSTNVEVRCKCHGMSGSCELKTCWRSVTNFRRTGSILKERYRHAVLVAHANTGSGRNVLRIASVSLKKKRKKKKKEDIAATKSVSKSKSNRGSSKPKNNDLVFLERSPNFCEADPKFEFLGTHGRVCNKTSADTDSCDSLCCGRGYNTIRQVRTERCNCRFKWCCHVICEDCTHEEWVTVCK
ncbi:Wnt10p [Chamberlinius hualienensis]